MNRYSSINEVKGIGAKTTELFKKMGVYTVGDILLHFPRTYIQYPKAISFPLKETPAEGMCAVKAYVCRSPVVKRTAKMPVTLLSVGDENDHIQIVWYRMPYIKNSVQSGKQYVFYGKLVRKAG